VASGNRFSHPKQEHTFPWTDLETELSHLKLNQI
jgi:hypothetical protein